MWNKVVSSPLVYVLLPLSVIVTTAIGLYANSKILLPVLQMLPAYAVMFTLVANEQRNRAFATMLFWALCMGIVMVYSTVHFPSHAAASIFNGTQYANEMFHWIRTGQGAEGDPLRFIPQHLLHLVIFILLSIFSASLLSLLMGALLMNYMSFYVGSFISASSDPALAALMGWHPWSIIRVASFVILGVILGEPRICRIVKRDYDITGVRPFLWGALTGLVLDIAIKAFLAPWWGLTLRKLL